MDRASTLFLQILFLNDLLKAFNTTDAYFLQKGTLPRAAITMLKKRIITAVLLLALVGWALFYWPPLGWFALATVMAALAAWEWGAFLAFAKPARILLGVLAALLSFALAWFFPQALGLSECSSVSPIDAMWLFGRWFYLPAAIFWLLIVPLWMKFRWALRSPLLGVLVGFVVIFPTWLAFIQLRLFSAAHFLTLLAAIWLADTAAYASGRLFGKHKLAPSISPGKTWEGALGGAVAVLIYGFCLTRFPAIFFSLFWGFVLLLFVALSILGDLFESLLKRQAGLKDSSQILPGHGGILDRIDSLTSTLPLVTLAWLLSWQG